MREFATNGIFVASAFTSSSRPKPRSPYLILCNVSDFEAIYFEVA